MAERVIERAGIELCTESFGDPGDPPVLLIMGTGGSMLWWEEGFCRMLAEGGRLVIRCDHRDTGRSTTCEPGHPGYTGGDLVADSRWYSSAPPRPCRAIARSRRPPRSSGASRRPRG
jgi:pimeloyl-ACP methyl ester carboxylesterase